MKDQRVSPQEKKIVEMLRGKTMDYHEISTALNIKDRSARVRLRSLYNRGVITIIADLNDMRKHRYMIKPKTEEKT
jgi:transcription initiation factor IIE alpha subunit